MRPTQLEAWVLKLLDQVRQGRKVEDSRVELKREFPLPDDAARRLAGHANASQGEPVLWVIGLDEKAGVVAFRPVDLAKWAAQLNAEFDSVAPAMTDVGVPTEFGELMALLFDTSRAPYVVRNRAHGNPQGGPVAWEVPWRSGTAVRSARREDLIRLLVPIQQLPSVEVLGATLRLGQRLTDEFWSILKLRLYVTPSSHDRIVIPNHHVTVTMRSENATHQFKTVRCVADERSHTIRVTNSEVVIDGPGRLQIHAAGDHNPSEWPAGAPIAVDLALRPANSDREAFVGVTLDPRRPGAGSVPSLRKWASASLLDGHN